MAFKFLKKGQTNVQGRDAYLEPETVQADGLVGHVSAIGCVMGKRVKGE